MKGSIYKNTYKQPGDKKPDFTGKISMDGVTFKVAAWDRGLVDPSKGTPGYKESISLVLTEEEEKDVNQSR